MSKTKTEQNYDVLKKMFTKELLRYIHPFTDHDDVMTAEIVEETLWNFAAIVEEPITFDACFGKALRQAQDCAHHYIKNDPDFDLWADWKKMPNYYPLNDPALTLLQKKMFCFYYYRNAEYVDLAKHFGITPKEAKDKVFEVFKSIARKMNEKIQRIYKRIENAEKEVESIKKQVHSSNKKAS